MALFNKLKQRATEAFVIAALSADELARQAQQKITEKKNELKDATAGLVRKAKDGIDRRADALVEGLKTPPKEETPGDAEMKALIALLAGIDKINFQDAPEQPEAQPAPAVTEGPAVPQPLTFTIVNGEYGIIAHIRKAGEEGQCEDAEDMQAILPGASYDDCVVGGWQVPGDYKKPLDLAKKLASAGLIWDETTQAQEAPELIGELSAGLDEAIATPKAAPKKKRGPRKPKR